MTAKAQSTSFTYQGRLADSGAPTNGNYDLQFALWNSSSGGGQVGSTQTINAVAISNGVFTVNLDFGANSFPGASRFLEIAVRPAGVGSFTTLTPRQPINSTPYAVRSLNAATAESVPASGVPSGSGNYIQNSTAQQATSNFNISGDGTADGSLSGRTINARDRYNLNGIRFLFADGLQNTYIGNNVGNAVTSAFISSNTLVGFQTGKSLAPGGAENTFVGTNAGAANTTGADNSFFGESAGLANTTGTVNAFFGISAGQNNTTGGFNAFLGPLAGNLHQTGSQNTFVGYSAGEGFNPLNLSNATAVGARATVTQNNSLVLGSIKGVTNATEDTNVGIGTTAPTARLSIVATGDGARLLHLGTERAWVFRQFGTAADTALELTLDSATNNNKNFLITTTGSVGIGTTAPTATLTVNGSANKPGGGSWGTFSDERLKNIKGRFTPGLHALMQLAPLRYEYKPSNALKLKSEGEYVGFSAQAVQKAIPEAVTKTESGYLVVNNDPILWTMLNAIKEQQKEIEKLKRRVAHLQRRRINK